MALYITTASALKCRPSFRLLRRANIMFDTTGILDYTGSAMHCGKVYLQLHYRLDSLSAILSPHHVDSVNITCLADNFKIKSTNMATYEVDIHISS